MKEANWNIEEIDEDAYCRFLSIAANSTIFHSLKWLKIIREGFNIGIRLLGFYQNGQMRAICPIEFQGPLVFRLSGSPLPRLFTPYQGILWHPEVGEDEKVASICLLGRYLRSSYFRMQWEPCGVSEAVFDSFEKAYTPTLDLKVGEESIFNGMKGETRNQVRQAAKRGIQVKFVQEGGDWINDYLRLSVSTYKRQGLKSPMREAFLRALFQIKDGSKDDIEECVSSVQPLGVGAMAVLALVDGKVVGASLIIYDRKTAYYLDNVSLREYQRYRANNAMMWEIIRWATHSGFTRYDLVGANYPSIAAFKFGFGAVRESFPVYVSFNKLGRAMYGASALVKGFRKRVLRGLKKE
jgi:hypothetical protein